MDPILCYDSRITLTPKPVNDIKSKLQTNIPHEQRHKSGTLRDQHTLHIKKKRRKSLSISSSGRNCLICYLITVSWN